VHFDSPVKEQRTELRIGKKNVSKKVPLVNYVKPNGIYSKYMNLNSNLSDQGVKRLIKRPKRWKV
jgi:hypothetical protein